MIRAGIVLVLSLAGSVGLSQTPIRIQSGEHAAFTRLVLSLDPSRDWAVTASEREAEFVLRGENVEFDISGVFARIPRARLADLSVREGPEQGSLVLGLNCACSVVAFGYQGAYVVLDIIASSDATPDDDPVNSPGAAPETRRAVTTTQSPTLFAPRSGGDAPMIAEISIGALAEPLIPPQKHHVSPPLPPLSDLTTNSGAAPVGGVATDAAIAARITQAQDALLTQLTRAADQGLITFAEPVAPPNTTKTHQKPRPAVVPETPESAPFGQVSATTVYDRDGAAALADIVNQFARAHCLDDSAFNFAHWGGDEDFNTSLGRLHSAMVDARDRPMPESAADLVRFYLRYGLGREARSLIASFSLAADNPALAELALLADNAPVPVGGVLDQGRGCGGAHELWRMIAQPVSVDAMPIEMESIFEAFGALPPDLRQEHVTALVATYLSLGAPDQAQRALDMVARAGQSDTAAVRLLRAELQLGSAPLAAESELEALVEDNTAVAPQAMLLWAGSVLARKAEAPDSLVQSLGAAAFERRGTAEGRALRLAEIRLRAGLDGFDTALSLIRDDLGRDTLADADLYAAAHVILANANPDPTAPSAYIETVMHYRDLLADGRAGDPARIAIARQLVRLALPGAALDLLHEAPAHDDVAQIVAATAELALFEPRAALDRLDQRGDLAALELKAMAHAQMGDHRAALDALVAANAAAEQRADAAFLAGAWDHVDTGVVTGAPDAPATLAAYMRQRTRPADETVPPGSSLPPMADSLPNTLEAARMTLEANRASRAVLQELLTEPTAR